jgi:hypothetical protein
MAARVETLCQYLEEAVAELDSARCLYLLTCLQNCPISVAVLRSTGAGKKLNKLLCKGKLPEGLEAEVFTIAAKLLSNWRTAVAADKLKLDAHLETGSVCEACGVSGSRAAMKREVRLQVVSDLHLEFEDKERGQVAT